MYNNCWFNGFCLEKVKKLMLICIMISTVFLFGCGGFVTVNEHVDESNNNNNYATIPGVVGLDYKEAKKALREAGFKNVDYVTKDNSSIWKEENWIVTQQSIEAGRATAIDTEIVLTCKSKYDSPTNTELIMEEGGVVAFCGEYHYSKGDTFVIIDCNSNTLYRFQEDGHEVQEYIISGSYDSTFRAGKREYNFRKDNSIITYVHEEYMEHARTNKSANLKKISLEYAYRMMELCYENDRRVKENDPYNELFAGTIVIFGQYIQNDELKPIEWIVLHTDQDKTLLISKYVLSQQSYTGNKDTSVECTWSSSTIRKWLNNDFFNDAFTTAEKKSIQIAEITQEGNTSKDRVFLLSSAEVSKYMESISTIARYGEGISDWWLRSAKDMFYKEKVDCIFGRVENSIANNPSGIRPAIWVKNDELQLPED